VIQYLDPHDLSGFLQASRNGNILAAGGRISGGMVVYQDHGRCRFLDRRTEHLARVNDALVETPFRDLDALDDTVFSVQQQDSNNKNDVRTCPFFELI